MGRRFFSRPVHDLLAAADRWRAGDYGVRTGLAGQGGEFGALGGAFDRMAEEIGRRQEEQSRTTAALRESEARFRAIVEDQTEFISRFDPDLIVTFINQAYAAQLGRQREELIGTSLLTLMRPDQQARFKAQLAALTPQAPTVSYEMDTVLPDGSQGWEQWTDRALFDETCVLVGYQSVGRDITDRKRADTALRESEERLRLAVEGGRLGTWDLDLASGYRNWSAQAAAIYGLPGDQVGGYQGWLELVHPDDRGAVREAFEDAVAGRTSGFGAEFRTRHPEGEWRWVASNGSVVRDERGRAVRAFGVVQDITERKRAEERQVLLLQELSHRVKNTLAVVQGIAAQSLSGERTLEAAREVLSQRLRALSRAHELLTASEWRGADLEAVVEGELKPFAGRAEGQGPDVRLSPKAGLVLALVFHELATNAAKHGALSTPEGSVAVTWRFEGSSGAARELCLVWKEQDGPPVAAPLRRGFGRRLIEQGLRHDLGGAVTLDFQADGLRCAIRIPASAAVGQP